MFCDYSDELIMKHKRSHSHHVDNFRVFLWVSVFTETFRLVATSSTNLKLISRSSIIAENVSGELGCQAPWSEISTSPIGGLEICLQLFRDRDN